MKKNVNLEKKISELNQIVEYLESDEVTLSEMIGKFEKAMKLAKECKDYLSEAEQKIIDIKQKHQEDS